MAFGPHQSIKKRKNRTTWNEKGKKNSKEQTKEIQQYWDKIWTRRRGLRWENPPSPPFLTYLESAVVFVKAQDNLGYVVSWVDFPAMNECFIPVKKKDISIKGLVIPRKRKKMENMILWKGYWLYTNIY